MVRTKDCERAVRLTTSSSVRFQIAIIFLPISRVQLLESLLRVYVDFAQPFSSSQSLEPILRVRIRD